MNAVVEVQPLELRAVALQKSLTHGAFWLVEIKGSLGWQLLRINGQSQRFTTLKQARKRMKLIRKNRVYGVAHG